MLICPVRSDAPAITFYGSSFISDPYGRVLVQAPRDEPAVIVADLDLDGNPEVVQVNGAVVYVFDAVLGTLLAQYSIGGFTSNGAPILGDFSGDGAPDIAVPLAGDYRVLQYDGTLKKLTNIWSAGGGLGAMVTGSAAADLDGDGALEVIYGDKNSFYIWSVATNTTLYSTVSYNGTTGGFVSPVVADYDGDGNAEVLLAASSTTGLWDELVVLHEDQDRWGNAPLIWNQYYYTGTNVAADMTVPSVPDAYWLGDNVFRSSLPPSGDPQGTADLALDLIGSCEECVGQYIVFYVSAENLGSERAGSYIDLSIYTLDAAGVATKVESAYTDTTILPGDHLQPTAILIDIGVIQSGGLLFSYDDDGTGTGRYNECDETNNTVSWNEQVCN